MKNKKKMTVSERLRAWDEGSFDLTDRIDLNPPIPEAPHPEDPSEFAPSEKQEARRLVEFRQIYPWLAGILAIFMSMFLLMGVLGLPAFGAPENPTNNEVPERYLADGMAETGAVNAVAGVILDYRAFDTLGESHVLFTAAMAVLVLLLGRGNPEQESPEQRAIMERDPILRNTARVLVPLILLFGVYIVLTGHLGPGGGFAGGAILGGGLILYAISFGFDRLDRIISFRSFRITIASALCFYSAAKCYSFFCGANGFETVFSTGTPGRILSAGLILPLNIAVGLIVSLTMYGFYSVFQRGRI